MNKIFYEVRDSIESGQYLKASMHTLRKYQEELGIPHPLEDDPRCDVATDKKRRMLNQVTKEIENRKRKRNIFVRSVVKGVLIGIIVGVFFLILSYIFPKNNTSKSKLPTNLPQSQESDQTLSSPINNSNGNKNTTNH